MRKKKNDHGVIQPKNFEIQLIEDKGPQEEEKNPLEFGDSDLEDEGEVKQGSNNSNRLLSQFRQEDQE